MFCPQCGAPQEDDAVYCSNCGAVLNAAEAPVEEPEGTPLPEPQEKAAGGDPTPAAPPTPPAPPSAPFRPTPPPPSGPSRVTPATSGLAIASLVMGIVGWTVLPLIGSVLAIIFGYMARNEIRQRPADLSGEGLAMAGIVLGWLMVGLSVLVLCVGIVGFCFLAGARGTSGF